MSRPSTRCRIVQAADGLFYRQGFDTTSFGDVADAVGISRGNFYHHFKAKDAMLEAVIERRIATTREMLAAWETASPDPAERICLFVRLPFANRAAIERHGCPAGTLCTELAKLDHPLLSGAAEVFELFGAWLERHFAALGHEDAAARAHHLLVFSQGAATLHAALKDGEALQREVERMCEWVRQKRPL